MSDTPRTDAARLCHFDEPVVPLDFASQLERELVEMQRENLVRQRSEMDLCQVRDDLGQKLADANNRASFFELVRVALGAETQMQALEIANRLRTDVEDWRLAAAEFATTPDGLRCELLAQEREIARQCRLVVEYQNEASTANRELCQMQDALGCPAEIRAVKCDSCAWKGTTRDAEIEHECPQAGCGGELFDAGIADAQAVALARIRDLISQSTEATQDAEDKLVVAKLDITRLNELLRLTGKGQGEIDHEAELVAERGAWRACAKELAQVLAANKRHTEGYHGHLCVIGTSEALAAFEKLKGKQ